MTVASSGESRTLSQKCRRRTRLCHSGCGTGTRTGGNRRSLRAEQIHAPVHYRHTHRTSVSGGLSGSQATDHRRNGEADSCCLKYVVQTGVHLPTGPRRLRFRVLPAYVPSTISKYSIRPLSLRIRSSDEYNTLPLPSSTWTYSSGAPSPDS